MPINIFSLSFFRASTGIALAATLVFGCAGAGIAPNPDKTVRDVRPVAETEPVGSLQDAADDPEIWVNREAPPRSRILGTDKKAGLAVYDLSGRQVQFLPRGRLNNVDLRYGFSLRDRLVDIAAASNRGRNAIELFAIDRAGGDVSPLGEIGTDMGEPYGLCMYRSRHSGKFYVFVNNKSGLYQQWELWGAGDSGEVEIAARKVREFSLASQPEGCVADDEMGFVYVGEEAFGVWKLPAEPDAGSEPVAVDTVANGRLVADVEGITLYAGAGGGGYLLVSSQGDDTYAVYDRRGDNPYLGSFRVVAATGRGVDGSSETDGLAATSAALGPDFPAGLLVVQDGHNPAATQNFKLINWADIETALKAPATPH